MRKWILSAAVALVGLTAAARPAAHPAARVSKPFTGAKVNGGTVTMDVDMGRIVLTLSDEVKDPKTPDAHWQIVDSKGRTYLLDRMTVKEDRLNRRITLPDYVKDVAKVVIYCAWAEANLGEASF
jgi:hypothetical protein